MAYTEDPLQGIVASYADGKIPGAESVPYNSGQGMYNVTLYDDLSCFY